jgi:hypothetical protein
LGTPSPKITNDIQDFSGLIVSPDATAGKSGTLVLPFCFSSNRAATASSLARLAFFV